MRLTHTSSGYGELEYDSNLPSEFLAKAPSNLLPLFVSYNCVALSSFERTETQRYLRT